MAYIVMAYMAMAYILMALSDVSSGRVEVYKASAKKWGTVCSKATDGDDADAGKKLARVVCRQVPPTQNGNPQGTRQPQHLDLCIH